MQANTTQYPSWVLKFLSADAFQRVATAVSQAEKSTTGEIVVMVVRRSSVIGHVPYFLFFTLAFLALLVDFYTHFLMTPLMVLILFPLCFWLARFKWIQRFFTRPGDRSFQVLERAEIEFHRHQMQQTQARTGVLIFLSLMEREAVVLGDRAISSHLPATAWQEIVQIIVTGIRKKNTEEALLLSVQKAGELLSTHFPASGSNPNELSNHVVVKE